MWPRRRVDRRCPRPPRQETVPGWVVGVVGDQDLRDVIPARRVVGDDVAAAHHCTARAVGGRGQHAFLVKHVGVWVRHHGDCERLDELKDDMGDAGFIGRMHAIFNQGILADTKDGRMIETILGGVVSAMADIE